MGKKRNTFRVLVGRLKGKNKLEDTWAYLTGKY
jgi:hypothetical protein